ncbi:MAG: NAD(P)-dependent alcohol dehydrogenase [Albidovulum sp.]|nr:NAD(P)-dependent alcohol dehydrogenase [Albidovulum sp.]
MEALVLERKGELALRDIAIEEHLGPHDVRVALRRVGVCGSDIHYYVHGGIGPFIVKEPMVLGHEASGEIVEVGSAVTSLATGDRVCMEPGIPDPRSRAARLGKYNLDPSVRFWATPPVHGVLRPTVVHPAEFTFRLPASVSYAAGAMVEPLAVGVHAATKAQIFPGATAVVIGAGTIGLVTVLAALAAGCSRVIVSDIQDPKLELAAELGPVLPVNARREALAEIVRRETDDWGADVVFEASGNAKAASEVFDHLCPGGTVVLIGMPGSPIAYDVLAAQVKEARVEHVFRYAHVYPQAVSMLASGKINADRLITDLYGFSESVQAFDFARSLPPNTVKVQIELQDTH